MATIGQLLISLEARSDKLEKELKKARGDLGRTQREMRKIGTAAQQVESKVKTSFSNIGKSVGLLRVGLIGAFTSVGIGKFIRQLSDFQNAISEVEAVTQATSMQMQEMQKVARELGATTKFTASEAAKGMAFLGRAGFKTNEIIKAIGPSLTLAAAGAISLSEAADITSNIMTTFNANTAQTQEFVDVLAAVSSDANTNILQLGSAFEQAGAVASAAGIPFNELASAIGILGKGGIQGEKAGTQLRGVIARLVKLEIPVENFADAIDQVAEANLSLTETFKKFGLVSAPTILSLVKQRKELRRLITVSNKATGTSKKMSAVMSDNLDGAIKRLNSAVGELVLTLGDSGLGLALRSTIDLMTRLVTLGSKVAGVFNFASQAAAQKTQRSIKRLENEFFTTPPGKRKENLRAQIAALKGERRSILGLTKSDTTAPPTGPKVDLPTVTLPPPQTLGAAVPDTLNAKKKQISDELNQRREFEKGAAAIRVRGAKARNRLVESNMKESKRLRDKDLRDQELASQKALRIAEKNTREQARLIEELKTPVDRFREAAQDSFAQAQQFAINFALKAEEAITGFVRTGKLDFKGLVDSMLADLTRIAVRRSITGRLAGLLGSSGNNPAGGGTGSGGILSKLIGGGGGILGSLLGGGGGGGGVGSASAGALSISNTSGGLFGTLADFAQGGIVRGPIGSAQRATVHGGEAVLTREQQAQGSFGGDTISVTVVTPDADSFKRSTNQIAHDTLNAWNRIKRRNGAVR